MQINIALVDIRTGKRVSNLIEKVSEEQFDAMNEAAKRDRTGFKYIQVNPLCFEVKEEDFDPDQKDI